MSRTRVSLSTEERKLVHHFSILVQNLLVIVSQRYYHEDKEADHIALTIRSKASFK